MLPRQPLLRMMTRAYLLLLSLILVPAKTNQSFSFRLDDILLSEPRPTPGRSIFFHETSCYDAKAEQHSRLNLSARQACAIESAALHNPNFQVFVLFADPKYRASPNGQSSGNQQPLVDAILSYGNVQLRRVNLWRYAAGTPVEEWLKNGQLFRSRFLVSHVSDFLRFVTLFRYGGLYLDMDVVVLQSMENVPPNYAGAESDYMLAAGIINLSATGIGHEIAELCLRDFQHNFNGHNWGNNGPGVITRVAQRICDTDYVALMQDDRKRCMGLKVYWRGAFYAVSSRQWRDLFNPDRLEQTMARTKYSYVVHVWNKQSNKVPIKVGSSSAYAKLAERNCPRAYHAAGEYF
ncbi:lactosylceramide 4-alpha-galactosyltransferase-like isoform X1 [Drosophila subobscura]|uniref:lactosylceramide 4-alpha-galactosyltransferase-like isoform X1 n=1 Tax=Drosophila subobscura TaxID=7241 RepID=UPI00155A1908|nr:lactosylceramide 4-alpha-galactosyltransferase-like isoform X1 [Drosophila subobscura]XP_034666933.1 lactosylceramide 4-alpha-galactosyltransferase-like isoform X1 [Drosophila subobscura]